MSNQRCRLSPAVLGLLVCLSGCQAAPLDLKAARFQLAAPIPVTAIPAASHEAEAGTGTLTISLRGLLDGLTRRRHVLATLADVAKVKVTVTVGGTEFQQTIEASAIAGGQTTATFNGLPVGKAVVLMVAYDASNAAIGEARQEATIGANQTTTVELVVTLAPSYLPPPPPSSGGGGSGAAPTGGLVANGTLVPGPEILGTPTQSVPRELQVFDVPNLGSGVAADAAGNVWVASYEPGGSSRVSKYSSVGAVVAEQTATLVYGLATGAGDKLWLSNPGQATAITTDGNLATVAGGCLALDADGNAWTAELWGRKISRFSPQGALLTSFDLEPGKPRVVTSLAFAAADRLWVGGSGLIRLIDPTGTVLEEHEVPSSAMGPDHLAVDRAGNVWFESLAPAGLYKLTPGGSATPVDPQSSGFGVGPDGDIWCATERDGVGVTVRYAPDGTLLATYPGRGAMTAESPGNTFGFGPDGTVWYLKFEGQQTKLVKLTP